MQISPLQIFIYHTCIEENRIEIASFFCKVLKVLILSIANDLAKIQMHKYTCSSQETLKGKRVNPPQQPFFQINPSS